MNAASGREGCHAVPFDESTAAMGYWPGNVVWLDEMTGLHWAKFPATTVELRSGRRVGITSVPLTAMGYIPGIALVFAIYVSQTFRRDTCIVTFLPLTSDEPGRRVTVVFSRAIWTSNTAPCHFIPLIMTPSGPNCGGNVGSR